MKQLKQLQRKHRTILWGFNGIRKIDLRYTSVMLYQLSYEALMEPGQEQVQFIPVIWREWCDVYTVCVYSVLSRVQFMPIIRRENVYMI